MMIYLQLFYEFFKTGLFTIGGGMATVPFLQDMAVKTGWFTSAQLTDMIAVAESTPGPMGVNMATYVGYTMGYNNIGVGGGILGAVIATLGLVAPSIIVITIIAGFLQKFRESKYVDAAFYGLRAASVALIAAAGVGVILLTFLQVESIWAVKEATIPTLRNFLLAIAILVMTRWIPKLKKLHPIYFIVLSAVIGVIFHFAGV